MAEGLLESPGEAAAEEEAARPVSAVVRQHLVFFLGLVPVAIAGMRVYLMGEGDSATTLTLVETLDVRSLMLGTFVKLIGVLGTAATGYLFCRLFWPRIVERRDPAQRRDSRWAASTFGLLLLAFLVSVGCLYPEEVFDWGSGSLWPIDGVRAVLWVLAAQGTFWLGFEGLQRLSDRLRAPAGALRAAVHRCADRGAALCDAVLRWYASSKPEVFLLAPAILLMFWVYLVTNDRMWLPPQVITVKNAPGCMLMKPDTAGACSGSRYYQVVRRDGGQVAFVGYVLDKDMWEETILRPDGGVLTVNRSNVTDVVACQDEPDFDPGDDAPILAHLSVFRAVQAERQNHRCLDVLHG
jgi:hypothetical protein